MARAVQEPHEPRTTVELGTGYRVVAVGFVADHEDDRGADGQILDAARELATIRDGDAESGATARLLEALDAIRPEIGETPAPAELLAALRAGPGRDWLKSPRRPSKWPPKAPQAPPVRIRCDPVMW